MRDPLSYRRRATPSRTGVVDATTERSWTYAELDDDVEKIAGGLAALGLDAGDRVGVAVSPRPAAIRLVHASFRLGTTLVPLPSDRSDAELTERIERAGCAAVVCGAETDDALRAAAGAVPVATVDDPPPGAAVTRLPSGEEVPTPHDWRPADPAVVVHPEGDTPQPVTLTAANVAANAVATACRLGHDRDDRWLVTRPLDRPAGLWPAVRLPIYGSTVVVRRGFEPGACVDDIAEQNVTCARFRPRTLRTMLDRRGTLAGSIRAVVLDGTPAPPDLIERCRNYSVPVYPAYGTAAACSTATMATPSEAYDDPETVGQPVFLCTLSVVDGTGSALPSGERGEIVVEGPVVAPSRDVDTERRAWGSHRTGDVGYVSGGRTYVLNRIEARIRTDDGPVDPGAVARAIRSHAAVDDVAVVEVGNDEGTVGALVGTESGTDIDSTAVINHCQDRLEAHEMPDVVGLADGVPRNDADEVDRNAVRRRLASRNG